MAIETNLPLSHRAAAFTIDQTLHMGDLMFNVFLYLTVFLGILFVVWGVENLRRWPESSTCDAFSILSLARSCYIMSVHPYLYFHIYLGH